MANQNKLMLTMWGHMQMIRMITAPHFNYNFSMLLLQMSDRLKETISDYH